MLTRGGILDSEAVKRCPENARIRIAGLVVMYQSAPTAHGVHFVTFEDEYGLIDIIIFPDVYERMRRIVRSGGALLVEGLIQQGDGIINVLLGAVMPLCKATKK